MRPIHQPVLYEELTYKIIGTAIDVHKELGPIHKELVYQKALNEAFKLRRIPFQREVQLPVIFHGKRVGVYIPDFIVEEKVILEIKAVPILAKNFTTQLSYYLKSTGYKIGLLINFGTRSLQVRRRIYG